MIKLDESRKSFDEFDRSIKILVSQYDTTKEFCINEERTDFDRFMRKYEDLKYIFRDIPDIRVELDFNIMKSHEYIEVIEKEAKSGYLAYTCWWSIYIEKKEKQK